MWLGNILNTDYHVRPAMATQLSGNVVMTLGMLFANVPLSWSKRCNYRVGSRHSSLGSSGTLLIWLQRRTLTVSSTTCQLEEAHWSPEKYLAEDNRWRSSVAELRAYTAWKKARDRDGLASSIAMLHWRVCHKRRRKLCNALTAVKHKATAAEGYDSWLLESSYISNTVIKHGTILILFTVSWFNVNRW